jgi:hypothetical protein
MPQTRPWTKGKIAENAIYRQKTADNDLLTFGAVCGALKPIVEPLLVLRATHGYSVAKHG